MPIVRQTRRPHAVLTDLVDHASRVADLARVCAAGAVPARVKTRSIVQAFTSSAAAIVAAARELEALHRLTDVPAVSPEGDRLARYSLHDCIHAKAKADSMKRRSRTRIRREVAAGEAVDGPPAPVRVAAGEPAFSAVSDRGLGAVPREGRKPRWSADRRLRRDAGQPAPTTRTGLKP